MNDNQMNYLSAMGIQVWQTRESKPALPVDDTKSINHMNWDELQKTVASCTACRLHCSRTQTVFGSRSNRQEADLMIIGRGRRAIMVKSKQRRTHFVGRAGQLLNAMLKSLKLDRTKVYIANILKCRPPNNRDPLPEEVALCTPFMNRQIELIKPKLLLAVGRIAAHYLLNDKRSLSVLRGKIYNYGENKTPLIVSYHPAYLLRNPKDKANACDSRYGTGASGNGVKSSFDITLQSYVK